MRGHEGVMYAVGVMVTMQVAVSLFQHAWVMYAVGVMVTM